MVSISSFGFGKATRAPAHVLQAGASVELVNADPNRIALTSFKGHTLNRTVPLTGRKLHLTNQEIQHLNYGNSVVETHDSIYKSDGTGKLKWYKGLEEYDVGLPKFGDRGESATPSSLDLSPPGITLQLDDVNNFEGSTNESTLGVRLYEATVHEVYLDVETNKLVVLTDSVNQAQVGVQPDSSVENASLSLTIQSFDGIWAELHLDELREAGGGFAGYMLKLNDVWYRFYPNYTLSGLVLWDYNVSTFPYTLGEVQLTSIPEDLSGYTFNPLNFIRRVGDTLAFTDFSSNSITYALAYRSEAKNLVAPPHILEPVFLGGADLTLTLEDVPDLGESEIYVYVQGGNFPDFTLIDSITSDDIQDGAVTRTYSTFESRDFVIDSESNYQPEEDLVNLTFHDSRLFASKGNTVFYSSVENLHAWPPENAVEVKEDVTGFLSTSRGLLIFSLNETYFFVVDQGLVRLSDSQGCRSASSCKTVLNYPFWVSNDGVCTWQGGQITVISEPYLGKVSLDVVDTAVYDQQYFIVTDTDILVVDLREGLRFFNLSTDSTVDSLTVLNDSLFFSSVGETDTQVYEMFSSEDDLTLEYLSPQFTEGDMTLLKMYSKIFINSSGTFELDVRFDRGREVISNLELTGDKVHQVFVPQDDQRTYSIQFRLTGTGTVRAIRAEPTVAESKR